MARRPALPVPEERWLRVGLEADRCTGCALGSAELAGTGFDTGFGAGVDAGGTAWLRTSAPVNGAADIRVRFAIWDTGDRALDSTALVDHLAWIASGGTVTVGTVPVPN